MGGVLVVLIMLAIAFWLGREFAHARRRQVFLATRDGRGRPMLPPHQRVGEDQLQRRAADLRVAVTRGDITAEEAIGSLLRLAGPALSLERARQMIDGP